MKKFEEKTIKTEKKFKGKIITLQVDEVELPNGKTAKKRNSKTSRCSCSYRNNQKIKKLF